MTPNYVSNSSMEVSQWCNCEGSGNQLQECLRILHMFNSNTCLRNAIENMGSASPRPVEGTLLPPPRPSPHIQHDELNVNLFEDLNSVVILALERGVLLNAWLNRSTAKTKSQPSALKSSSRKSCMCEPDRVN
ncbi:GDNF family receptor alpha-3 isoform X1 [Tachysurus ichikawai]